MKEIGVLEEDLNTWERLGGASTRLKGSRHSIATCICNESSEDRRSFVSFFYREPHPYAMLGPIMKASPACHHGLKSKLNN